jgi:hypothetical protein
VAELLQREPGGEQLCSLPDLERTLGRRPLVRAGADEFETAFGQFDGRAGRLQGFGDGFGHGVKVAEVSAERDRELRKASECTEMAGGERARGFLGHRLDVGAGRALTADRDRRYAVRASTREHFARVVLRAAVAEQNECV